MLYYNVNYYSVFVLRVLLLELDFNMLFLCSIFSKRKLELQTISKTNMDQLDDRDKFISKHLGANRRVARTNPFHFAHGGEENRMPQPRSYDL